MVIVICLMLPIIAAIGAAAYRSWAALPFAAGTALSTVANVVKVILLERTVARAVTFTDTVKAGNYLRLQNLLRFGVTAAALMAAVIFSLLDAFDTAIIYGAAVGVLSFQVAAFSIKGLASKQVNPINIREDGEDSGTRQ